MGVGRCHIEILVSVGMLVLVMMLVVVIVIARLTMAMVGMIVMSMAMIVATEQPHADEVHDQPDASDEHGLFRQDRVRIN